MSNIYIDDEEVLTNINTFANTTLINNLIEATQNACYIVEAEAKERCPAQTGTLRQSIMTDVEKEGDNIVGYIGSNLDYAPYIHQGTGLYAKDGNGRKDIPWHFKDAKGEWHSTNGIKPNPFLQDAVDAKQNEIIKCFKGVVK